jgi:ornithine carbamoyltransferase
MKKDILSILDLNGEELSDIMALAGKLKSEREKGVFTDFLYKKSVGLIFEKASTRTRISFETGIFELGGHPLFLNPNDMQLGRGELIADTARVLSRYLSAIMMRSYSHKTVEELARHSTIRVINGLSDEEHPCQILADIMTMRENFGDDLNDLSVVWIGDGNNVCNSLMLSSALTGYRVNVATPPAYSPPEKYIQMAKKAGAKVKLFDNPHEAVDGADVIYTDTWISMGCEEEIEARINAFSGYKVDDSLLRDCGTGTIVLHCLPAHRGQEISDEVIDGPASRVWDQAENRLHAQKALLVKLLGSDI